MRKIVFHVGFTLIIPQPGAQDKKNVIRNITRKRSYPDKDIMIREILKNL